jgi:sterol desaturase/sphingolipid hydroxylase (fatty acid hydroxylase superfamily)
MDSLLIDRQEDIYAAIFYGAVIFFAVLEFLLPRVAQGHGIGARWLTNIALGAGNVLLVRLVMPIGLVAFALLLQSRGWGLFNMTALPLWLTLPVGILALDLAKYGEHILMHRVPLLWRLHAVHHADLDVDVTTGFRHHPAEALAGLLTLPLVTLIFGVSPLAVLIYEMLAAVVAIFSHANIRYTPRLDGTLRLVFMTRDAHAVHHSCHRAETDSNYGMVFLFWDRLFGTYRAAPTGGLDGMTCGLDYFREPRNLRLHNALMMPLRVPGPGHLTLAPNKRPLPPAS